MDLLDIRSMEELKRSYREWVGEWLSRRDHGRKPRWTESIAVGSEGIRIGFGRRKKRPCPILVKERQWREGSIGNSFRRGFLGERGKSWEGIVQGVVKKGMIRRRREVLTVGY
jgi:hypothetical protein